jgi:hypothetical protein
VRIISRTNGKIQMDGWKFMNLHRHNSWRRNRLSTIDPIIWCIYAGISRVSTQVELRLYTLNGGSCIVTHTHTFNPWYPQFHTPNSRSIQHNFDQFVVPQPEESMPKKTHIIKIITSTSQIQCKPHEKFSDPKEVQVSRVVSRFKGTT